MTQLARRERTTIARPLKVLIPLIQADLERGDRAGMEYYADAGDKLIEAKEQVAHGYWGSWLSKNFERSQQQARTYMRYARLRADNQNDGGSVVLPRSLHEMEGGTTRRREQRRAESNYKAVLRDGALGLVPGARALLAQTAGRTMNHTKTAPAGWAGAVVIRGWMRAGLASEDLPIERRAVAPVAQTGGDGVDAVKWADQQQQRREPVTHAMGRDAHEAATEHASKMANGAKPAAAPLTDADIPFATREPGEEG